MLQDLREVCFLGVAVFLEITDFIFLNSQEWRAENLSLFVQAQFLELHLTVNHFLSSLLQLDLIFQIKIMRGWYPAYCQSLGRFYPEVFSPSCWCMFRNLSLDASTIHSPAGLSECSSALETERFMTFGFVQFLILDHAIFLFITIASPCLNPASLGAFQWQVLTVAQNLPLQSGTVCPQMPYLG